jgi:restriction endonuclease S subunit
MLHNHLIQFNFITIKKNLKCGSVYLFPLPPLAEQHEIVCRVNALFAHADAIEREVTDATKRAEAMGQAVLGKAFSGKL